MSGAAPVSQSSPVQSMHYRIPYALRRTLVPVSTDADVSVSSSTTCLASYSTHNHPLYIPPQSTALDHPKPRIISDCARQLAQATQSSLAATHPHLRWLALRQKERDANLSRYVRPAPNGRAMRNSNHRTRYNFVQPRHCSRRRWLRLLCRPRSQESQPVLPAGADSWHSPQLTLR